MNYISLWSQPETPTIVVKFIAQLGKYEIINCLILGKRAFKHTQSNNHCIAWNSSKQTGGLIGECRERLTQPGIPDWGQFRVENFNIIFFYFQHLRFRVLKNTGSERIE